MLTFLRSGGRRANPLCKSSFFALLAFERDGSLTLHVVIT